MKKGGWLVVLVALLLVVACGKKGGPRPPEAFAPSPVKFFTARGDVDAVVLLWEAPTTNADGEDLEDLERFVIKRNENVKKDERRDFEDIGEIAIAPKAEGEEPAEEEAESAQFEFRDIDVAPGQTYEYVVVGENEDGVEGNVASILRITFVGEASVVEPI